MFTKLAVRRYLVLALAACGGGGHTAAPDAPAPAPNVVFTMPAAGATEVAADAAVTVSFDELVDPAATTITLADDAGTTIAGKVIAWPDGAAFTPTGPLAADHTYTATVTAATSAGGTPLAAPVSWMFSTHKRAWSMPVTISQAMPASSYGPYDPQIAMNAAGAAFAIWRQTNGTTYGLWANMFEPDTGWGAPTLLSTTNAAFVPRIAVDPNGNAVAVWVEPDAGVDSIWSCAYTAGTGWATSVRVEQTTGVASWPVVGMDGAGNAIAVWVQVNGTRGNIWTNRYSAGVGWGTAQLLDNDDVGDTFAPALAVDATGDAVAVWAQLDASMSSHVAAARYVHGGTWGTPLLVDGAMAGQSPQVAIDASGAATAVWAQGSGMQYMLGANSATSAGAWGTASMIAAATGFVQQQDVKADDAGNVIAFWNHVDSTTMTINAAQKTASGWTSPVVVNGAGGSQFALGVSPNGTAIGAWLQVAGSDDEIAFARFVPGSGWSSPKPISSYVAGAGSAPSVALDAQGRAIAAWGQLDTSGRYEMVAAYFQ